MTAVEAIEDAHHDEEGSVVRAERVDSVQHGRRPGLAAGDGYGQRAA
jgi:hypothetical protein